MRLGRKIWWKKKMEMEVGMKMENGNTLQMSMKMSPNEKSTRLSSGSPMKVKLTFIKMENVNFKNNHGEILF